MADTNPLTFLRIHATREDVILELVGPTSTCAMNIGPREAMRLRIEKHGEWSWIFVDDVERMRITGLVVMDRVRLVGTRLSVELDGFAEQPLGVAQPARGTFRVDPEQAPPKRRWRKDPTLTS